MTAQQGMRRFLFAGKTLGQLTATDIELAIEIAARKNPSAAVKEAQRQWIFCHPEHRDWAMGFGKGVRWLALIRRDEGQVAFEVVCEELRQAPQGQGVF